MAAPLSRVAVADLVPRTAVAFCSWGGSRRDAFAATSSGLWHTWSDDGTRYASPEVFEAPWNGTPAGIAASSWGMGRIDVFVVDGAGSVQWARFDTERGWRGWTDLGGDLDPSAAIGAASRARGVIDVFGLGRDGRLRQLQREGGSWSAWGRFDEGGVSRRGIGAAARSGRLLLVTTSGGWVGLPMFRRFSPERGWDDGWSGFVAAGMQHFIADDLPSPALLRPALASVGAEATPVAYALSSSPFGPVRAKSAGEDTWDVASVPEATSLVRPAIVAAGPGAVDVLTLVTHPVAGELSFARTRILRLQDDRVVATIDPPVR